MIGGGENRTGTVRLSFSIDKSNKAPHQFTQISKFLKGSSEKEVRQNMKFAPAWIRALVFEIMELYAMEFFDVNFVLYVTKNKRLQSQN